MHGSSELSDALNPNLYFSGPPVASNNAPVQPSQSPPPEQFAPVGNQFSPFTAAPPYTPHRSELEDAINPAVVSPSPVARPVMSKPARQSSADPMQLLKGLIQSLSSHKEAVENEKRRRLVWEQEMQRKFVEQQAALENKLVTMQQEVDRLRGRVGESQTLPSTNIQPTLALETRVSPKSMPATPSSFTGIETYSDQPEFVQGSSNPSDASRKRPRSRSASTEHGPMKLRTRHDSRPRTIQAAMRNHILRSMDLESDKNLPPSHPDGQILSTTDPVRFVWDQTIKKSTHNAVMKARVVADMTANKDLYPLVPAQEFTKAKLDGVFEQAFTTMRQKFSNQQGGAVVSEQARERADTKFRRARRLSRKKTKLANRVTTRKTLEEYSLSVFDAAFQMECMSSEESSEEEEDPDDASSDEERLSPVKFLRIRYLAWRSSRLHRLYQVIDEKEELDRSTKPKRGIGRKDRRMGLPKDGNPPPPKGVSQWMISKRWLREAHATNPKFGEVLRGMVKPEDDDVPWHAFPALGEESDVEQQRTMQGVQTPRVDAEYHQEYVLPAQHSTQQWAEGIGGQRFLASPQIAHYPPN